MEFQLRSHTENVGMTFLYHQRHSGTQVIKESVCLSELVKRVEQDGHYFVVAEIEGTKRRRVRKT